MNPYHTMKRYIILAIIALPLGAGIGWLTSEKQHQPKPSSHMHSYGMWKSSQHVGGWGRTRIIMERKCYVCGNMETKLSD